MIKPLTSLRFFAALLVFCAHCPLTMFIAWRYFTGNAGVEFFFVPSGFILTYVHRDLLKGRLDWLPTRDFWVARFARIYPVHLLALALAMVIVYRSHGGFGWIAENVSLNLQALLAQITLTQSWVYRDSLFNFNGPAWSVSDEVFFYAVFPLLALALYVIISRLRWYDAIVVALVLWICTVAIATRRPGEFLLYTFPPTRLLDFAIGCCLGAAFSYRKPTNARVRYALDTAIEAGALGAGLAAIALTPVIPETFRYSAARRVLHEVDQDGEDSSD